METAPLETFTSPRKREADKKLLSHELFERLMVRADVGYEDLPVVQQVLREVDAIDMDFIIRCINRAPDLHLADIGYPHDSSVGLAPMSPGQLAVAS